MNISHLFSLVDNHLITYRSLWQYQAFHYTHDPWPDYPGLWQAAQSLPDDALGQRSAFLGRWLDTGNAFSLPCQLPLLSGRALSLPSRLHYAVPGRKWSQVQAFAALVPGHQHIVEWCAGHGHLGRVLAANSALSVTSLELDGQLCHKGEQLAARAQAAMQFAEVDVMTDSAARYLSPQCHTVALHACGDLHIRLLKTGSALGISGLTLSPCCYHLTRQPHYRSLSSQGASSKLSLSREDLKLAVKATVTAGARDRRRAGVEVRWRLGFDSWQRALRGVDEYLPVPNIPGALLQQTFYDFARWAAQARNLPNPARADAGRYQQLGNDRYRTVRRMEWVQQHFQRPLELWLLLDRALFMVEQNYRVQIGEFCGNEITPRNLILCANRID